MEIERQTVVQDPQTGSTEAVHTVEQVPTKAAVEEVKANKANAYIWYVIGFINILVALRFIFLLLGARNTGFTSFLYQITSPLVAAFKGIFPSPSAETGYFDTASLLAIVVYVLIGWGIVSLIDISKRNKVA